MIGIIDYGMGNLKSVANAMDFLGYTPRIIQSGNSLDDVSHLILPGVGSFDQAMQNLTQQELVQPLINYANSGRPLLGICLGMQLFADYGTEGTKTAGLGLIKGNVIKFDIELRIPHVGWNGIEIIKKHPILSEVKNEADFYFVHSYHFVADNNENVLAKTSYGIEFNSIVNRDNIIGIQFHPEKSQKQGMKILKNFAELE